MEMQNEYIPFAKPYLGLFSDRLKLKEELGRIVDEMAIGKKASNGERVRRLEEQVAKISGADFGIACSSCSQGLLIMVASCGAKGECFQQSFTWDSTLIAANDNGHSIIPLEIDYETWTVKHFPLHGKPAYAIAVDTFGYETTPTSDVPIFYDRAHSMGVRFRQLGIASVLSMSPSKIASASEGGIIVTNKANFAKAMEEKRNIISRMSEYTACVGLHNLKFLNDLLEWKKDSYEMYKKAFPMFQFQPDGGNHQVIGMLLESHEQQQRLLKELQSEIELKAYYTPTHIKYNYPRPLPVTEDVSRRIICLPSWFLAPRGRIIERIKQTLNI